MVAFIRDHVLLDHDLDIAECSANLIHVVLHLVSKAFEVLEIVFKSCQMLVVVVGHLQ